MPPTAAPPATAPLLLRALRGEPVERTPVWFMRQAGRSLPEYREIRRGRTLVEITHEPELAAEVTMQPVRRHDVDAAILFSDIVTPLEAIGVGVEIRPGVGPVIEQPFSSPADLARLRDFTPAEDAPWLVRTVQMLRDELDVPLIGFAGGPFTVASYLVEGGPSKTQARTKALMLSDPITWRMLLERLAAIALQSLRAQVEAGAQAVQLFDSWIGSLTPSQYAAHVQPVVTDLLAALGDLGVPRIMFGVGTGHLLEHMADAGPDVLGVDWRIPLDQARARVGDMPLQGNLDPAVLLAPWDAVEMEIDDVLARAPRTGHVFNLGHGVLPETPPEVLGRVVQHVRERTTRSGA